MASLKESMAARSAEAAQLVELRDKDYDKALSKAKGKEEALSKELVKVRMLHCSLRRRDSLTWE